MKAVKYIFSFCFLAIAAKAAGPGENFCSVKNFTTQDGETISYKVFYSLAGASVLAGEASFQNKMEAYHGRTVYHVTGSGASNARYDWLYKVRDRYESFIDTATMQPLRFERNVSEGSTKKYESVSFNRQANTAVTDEGLYKVPQCVQDVLSAIYLARNLDFTRYKPNEKIPFQIFLENKVYDLYVRYVGKQQVKIKLGTFNAVKFKVLLIPGTIFKANEEMVVWVSDDRNKIPVRIEAQILIGSVKVDMMAFKNLRYPLSSLLPAKPR